MKKALLGLALGGFLAGSVAAQEPVKSYEYDIYAGFLKMGSAVCSNDSVRMKFGVVDDIKFVKGDSSYYETMGHEGKKEFLEYSFDGNWRFDKYSSENPKVYEKRKPRMNEDGFEFDKGVIVGPEVFSRFEGYEIPDTLNIVAFSRLNRLVKTGVEYNGDLVEVKYRHDNYVRFSDDPRNLEGDLTAILRKEADGSYTIAGGRIPVSWKTWIKDFRFNLEIRERSE